MEIWHHIGINPKPLLEARLESLGVNLTRHPLPGGHYTVTFDADELDPLWSRIEPVIRYESKVDIYETSFTQEEIRTAEWVRLHPTFEWGYPQPEETWQFEPRNLAQKCPKCGAGYTQIAPYRISKEPRIGTRDFLCLYWTYTTAFCTKRVVGQLQKQSLRGYEVWDAILHHTGSPSETISQLVPTYLTSNGLAKEDQLKPVTCDECGITKYAYHSRGYMYYVRNALRDDVDMLYTGEWFGSGDAAFREVLVSNRFAKLVLEQGWKGIALKPLKLV